MKPILPKSWLINFRWSLLVLTLVITFFSNTFGLDKTIYHSTFFFIFAIAISNYFLKIIVDLTRNEYSLLSILIFDIVLISFILNSSGGATNPFSILFLVYVVFSSILLKPFSTFIVVIASIGCFGALLRNVSEHHLHGSGEYFNHLNGMWFAYSLVAIICAFTISTLAKLLKETLKKTEELANNQMRLNSLTTLSAGAAHELRTPLNTINLCIDDLKFLLPKDDDKVSGELETMADQISRCLQIIKDLSLKASEIEGEKFSSLFLDDFLTKIRTEFERESQIEIGVIPDNLQQKILIPQQAIFRSLRSLVQNSIESSENPLVKIGCRLSNDLLTFNISDNGSGIKPEIKNRIGEPFITSKEPGKGMGLGIFIAKLTANCYGGDLTFRSDESTGTTALLSVKIKLS